MSHQPRKRFGQNFLQNPAIIQQIMEALHLQPDDKVIEIGPGLGALTKPLLALLNHLMAIEIDRDLQAHLINSFASTQKLTLLNADALTVDYAQWGNNLRIIGNLPYNVATPLIIYLLSFASYIVDMHFMLQKEVALRLSGQPGTKDYGRLSVMVQYHCEVEYLFDVPPDSFYPKPKVDSAIVRLVPHRVLPFPVVDIAALQSVVMTAFSMRRKTLANNVKALMGASQLIEIGIDPGLRPEQVTVIDFVRMARYVTGNVGEE